MSGRANVSIHYRSAPSTGACGHVSTNHQVTDWTYVTCKRCLRHKPGAGPYSVRTYRRHDANAAREWAKIVDATGRTVQAGFESEESAKVACDALNAQIGDGAGGARC